MEALLCEQARFDGVCRLVLFPAYANVLGWFSGCAKDGLFFESVASVTFCALLEDAFQVWPEYVLRFALVVALAVAQEIGLAQALEFDQETSGQFFLQCRPQFDRGQSFGAKFKFDHATLFFFVNMDTFHAQESPQVVEAVFESITLEICLDADYRVLHWWNWFCVR